MRCLSVTVRPPFPPHDGGAIRAFNILKGLKRKFTLDAVSLVPSHYDQSYLPELETYCDTFTPVKSSLSPLRDLRNVVIGTFTNSPMTFLRYNQRAMREKLARMAQQTNYDVVFFNNIHSSHYVDLFPNALKVLDMQNNDTTLFKRWAENQRNPVLKAFGNLQARLAIGFVRKQFPQLDMVQTVSEKEEKEVRGICSDPQVRTVCNGVDLEYFTFDKRDPDPDMILFSGAMHWIPNYDGAEFFLSEIFPLIKKRCPKARIVLAGKEPPEKLLSFAGKDVEFTGFVKDLRDYINKAAVSIVPLRIGGGTRLKIVEAMATKTPVVSTSIGAEGINCLDGEHLLIRDTPEDFANGVCEVLENKELRQNMTEKGYELVKAQYDWVSITNQMAEVIEQNALEKKK